MREQSNPLPRVLLALGAALCIGASAWDDAAILKEWPVIVVTILGALTIVLALASVLVRNVLADAGGVAVGLVLAGYVADQVVLQLWLSHQFRDAVVLASGGSALLLAAGLWDLVLQIRPRAAIANVASSAAFQPQVTGAIPATTQVATAPPGWYADPAGGGGQRYWDGSAWGQRYP